MMKNSRGMPRTDLTHIALLTILPILILFVAFPMSGMTNNGNCDSWYYWGMARSSKVASSTLGIDYYPGSRVLMYAPGWLIPHWFELSLWSKMFAIIPVFFFVMLIYIRFRGGAWQRLLLTSTSLLLLPIAFTQISANYAITTFLIVLSITVIIIYDTKTTSKFLILGFLVSCTMLTNPEGMVFIFPMVILFMFKQRRSLFNILLFGTLGLTASFFTIVLIMLSQESTRKFAFSFYRPQFNAVLDSFRNPNAYFSTSENLNSFLASPVPLIMILSIVLSFAIYRRDGDFPRGFDYQLVTVMTLFAFQWFQFGNPLSESFNSVPLISVLVVPLNYVLANIANAPKAYLSYFLYQGSLFVCAFFVVLYVVTLGKGVPLVLFHIILPILTVLVATILVVWRTSRAWNLNAYAVITLIVLSSLAIGDYSRPFYQKENVLFLSQSAEFRSEYKIASAGIELVDRYGTSNNYAGIAFENINDDREIKYARSASRAFSSCGHPWSTFTIKTGALDQNTELWPSNLLIASPQSFKISELSFIDSYTVLKTKYIKLDNTNMKLTLLRSIHK